MFMQEEAISAIIDGLLADVPSDMIPEKVFFYGASCGSHELSDKVRSVLNRKLPMSDIRVESDLLGTARALCGPEPGFAAILGTGSNACIFNGSEIEQRMVSFGFWLGDEGSGGYLGKKVFRAWLKGELPASVETGVEAVFGVPAQSALKELLEDRSPNARVAKLGGLAIQNKSVPFFKFLIQTSLNDFFEENAGLIQKASELPFHFSGSVALHLYEELQNVLLSRNLKPGIITDRTTRRLFDYHESIL
jgi:N-acetylglucosamine kinase-like BadF-type ATPase